MKAADDFRMRVDDDNEDREPDDRCRRRSPTPQVWSAPWRLGAGRACDRMFRVKRYTFRQRLDISNSTLQHGAGPLSVSQDEVSQRIARLALSLQMLLIGEPGAAEDSRSTCESERADNA